jgi:excisionase family DNA binding protein
MDMSEPYVALKAAARAGGLPRSAVEALVRQGLLPAYRVGGKLLMRVSELQAALERCRLQGRGSSESASTTTQQRGGSNTPEGETTSRT